jgi:TolA-binding protein
MYRELKKQLAETKALQYQATHGEAAPQSRASPPKEELPARLALQATQADLTEERAVNRQLRETIQHLQQQQQKQEQQQCEETEEVPGSSPVPVCSACLYIHVPACSACHIPLLDISPCQQSRVGAAAADAANAGGASPVEAQEATGKTAGAAVAADGGDVPKVCDAEYRWTAAPGMICGKSLKGSGDQTWPGTVEKALELIKAAGHIPGKTCQAVQKAGGKVYYYGPGKESGEAGDDCWR